MRHVNGESLTRPIDSWFHRLDSRMVGHTSSMLRWPANRWTTARIDVGYRFDVRALWRSLFEPSSVAD